MRKRAAKCAGFAIAHFPFALPTAFDAIGNSKVLEDCFNMIKPGCTAIEVGVAPQQQVAGISPFMLSLVGLVRSGSPRQ